MEIIAAIGQLENSIKAALETYSNVHRGSGHNSLVSTELFEYSRKIVLDYLHLAPSKNEVIFCTPFRAARLAEFIKPDTFQSISSTDLGLPLGVVAMVVRKNSLPRGVPFQPGGGTVKIVSPNHVLWANAPDKFESGTPAIVNVIAFAKALLLVQNATVDFHKNKRSVKPAEVLATNEYDTLVGKTLLEKVKLSLIGKSLPIPTESSATTYTNLDNGASTPTFQPVWEAARKSLSLDEKSSHVLVEVCRKQILDFIDAPNDEFRLIFASNTTEAINIAAMNYAKITPADCSPVIVNSILEHNSNELPWRYIPGCSLIRVNVDDEGFVDFEKLEELLHEYNADCRHGEQRIRLISISGASNVMGSFNDVAAISKIAHDHNALILVDAAQLIAHRKISLAHSGIDMLAFSAHKAYAPFGSGGLIIRKNLIGLDEQTLKNLDDSGNQNVMGIAAITKVFQLFKNIGMDVVEADERHLTELLLHKLSGIPGIRIYGVCSLESPRLLERSGVITVSFKHIPFNLAANRLAEIGGIGVRSGCFCAHLLGKQLLGIKGFGAFLADAGFRIFPRFTKSVIPGLVRISIGLENDEKDIKKVIDVIQQLMIEKRTWFEQAMASLKNGVPVFPRSSIKSEIDTYIQSRLALVFDLD